jgi:hypothetical protein
MEEENSVSTWRSRLAPLLYLSNNWISRIGVFLVTGATIIWLFMLPVYLRGEAASAYIGIALFMLLPGAFFGGLFLIPAGIYWLKRRRRGKPLPSGTFPELTWRHPELRKLAVFVGAATFVNIIIGASFTYRAVHYMESVQFCGTACHTVMQPEYTAYQNSPHARVECVKCHIGPGASWFVKSKMSGAWQVVAVTFDLYPRPIPTPVENLRPARETCETCHWPDKYGGNRLRTVTHFSDEGERLQTVLMMHIGGGGLAGPGMHGIHLAKGVTFRYGHSTPDRQIIPWVEVTKNGETEVFTAPDFKESDLASLTIREMDCMDCHNRPSHAFELPERALDNAMAAGEVVYNLPGLRPKALEAMKATYSSHAEAEVALPSALIDYYQSEHPDIFQAREQEVRRSAQAVLAIYKRNVFPAMNLTWGTYPNNIGHTDFPGCFRCHSNEHTSAKGNTILQDCSSCHELLAIEEPSPAILTDLGVASVFHQ